MLGYIFCLCPCKEDSFSLFVTIIFESECDGNKKNKKTQVTNIEGKPFNSDDWFWDSCLKRLIEFSPTSCYVYRTGSEGTSLQ